MGLAIRGWAVLKSKRAGSLLVPAWLDIAGEMMAQKCLYAGPVPLGYRSGGACLQEQEYVIPLAGQTQYFGFLSSRSGLASGREYPTRSAPRRPDPPDRRSRILQHGLERSEC